MEIEDNDRSIPTIVTSLSNDNSSTELPETSLSDNHSRGIGLSTASSTNESVKGKKNKIILFRRSIVVVFTADSLTPYGWPCVRGLFRFLIQLINNYDKNNNEYMITVGLNLLTVALEVGADYLAHYPLLLSLVKDSLCRNLLSVRIKKIFSIKNKHFFFLDVEL